MIPVFIGQKPSKYKNIKTEIDGITFASKKEAKRYAELKLLERAKQISGLKLQPRFEIIPGMRINGKLHRAIHYLADFEYIDNGVRIIEDVKGMQTDVFGIKLRLMKQVHGIEVILI